MLDQTKLKKIGIGIVIKNKNYDSNVADILPIEQTALADGVITADVQLINAVLNDGNNKKTNSSVYVSQGIKAEWLLGENYNRMTSPDLRVGESVELYQYSGLNKYYWKTFKNDSIYRDLEHVIYAFVADKKNKEEINKDNAYTITVSTKEGFIEINTSQANNESYSYNILLDPKNGIFKISDNVDNQIFIDSTQNEIKHINGDETYISLNKKNLKIFALDNVSIQCKNYSLKADDSIETVTKEESNISDKLSVEAKEASIDGTSLAIGSPTALNGGVTGDTSFGGNITSSSGTLSVKDITTIENITAGGNITGANFP